MIKQGSVATKSALNTNALIIAIHASNIGDLTEYIEFILIRMPDVRQKYLPR